MTDVLVARGGFADDTALLRLHHAAGLTVRTAEADLASLREEQIHSPRRSRPACIVFAAGDADRLVAPTTLAALSRLTSAHPDVAFVAVLAPPVVDGGTPTDRELPAPAAASLLGDHRVDDVTAARVALLEAGADEVVCLALPPAELAARVGAVLRRVRKARLGHASSRRGARPVRCPAAPARDRAWDFRETPDPAGDASSSAMLSSEVPTSFPPSSADGLRPWVDPGRRELVGREGRVSLTAKEATLMNVLAAHDRVVAREELGALLWTGTWSGSAKAIDMHIANLRRKLATVSGAAWRIDTVRGVGFVLEAVSASSETAGGAPAEAPARFGADA